MKNDPQNQFIARPFISVALAIAMGAASVGCETPKVIEEITKSVQQYFAPLTAGALAGILAKQAGANKPLAIGIGIGVGALTAHFIAKAKATERQKEEARKNYEAARNNQPSTTDGKANATPQIVIVEVTSSGTSTAGNATGSTSSNPTAANEAQKEEKVQMVFYDSEKKQVVGDQVWESAVRPKNGEELIIDGKRTVFVAATPNP